MTQECLNLNDMITSFKGVDHMKGVYSEHIMLVYIVFCYLLATVFSITVHLSNNF